MSTINMTVTRTRTGLWFCIGATSTTAEQLSCGWLVPVSGTFSHREEGPVPVNILCLQIEPTEVVTKKFDIADK